MSAINLFHEMDDLNVKLENADIILRSVIVNYFMDSAEAVEKGSTIQTCLILNYQSYTTLISTVSQMLCDLKDAYADVHDQLWEKHKEQQKALESMVDGKGGAEV